MCKKIMILGGSELQLPAIIKAKEMGLYVINVDMNLNCLGFKYADETLKLSTIDYEGIKRYIDNNKIDGIMTLATDRPVNVVAKIAEEFKLAAVSVEAALNSTNKANMRRVLSKYNIKMPSFFCVTNFEDFCNAVDRIEGPVIIKASDNAGKKGVSKLMDKNSLPDKQKTFLYALNNSNSKEVLIEEVLFGREYSVETITYDSKTEIIAITKKYNSGEPHFVEIGHSQPADLTYSEYLDIKMFVTNIISILQINNTACHVEIMLTKTGVHIIEIGPRLAGDNISTALVTLSTGIDMVKAAIQMCLGENPEFERKFNKGSSIKYLIPRPGLYDGFFLEEDIYMLEGFYDFVITKQQGEKMMPLENSQSRIGYVIFFGNDMVDAETKAQKAINAIKLLIKSN